MIFNSEEEAQRIIDLQNKLLKYPRKTKHGYFVSVCEVTGNEAKVFKADVLTALKSPYSYRVLEDVYDEETGKLVVSDRQDLLDVCEREGERYVLPHVVAAEENS